MSLLQGAYLLKQDDFVRCVVTDKSLIKNAKEEDFEEITLYLTKEDIEEWNEVLTKNQEDEEEY